MTIPDPLERPLEPRHWYAFVRAGLLRPTDAEQTLRFFGIFPNRTAWRAFLETTLLWLGSTFTLIGIVFFFAYNWAEMSRFAKFGLLEGVFALACLLAVAQDARKLASKVALFVASALVGVLLALFGQVYQIQANTYGLFLTWAILITPWVILSCFAFQWFMWLVLLNLSLILYWIQTLAGSDLNLLFLSLFALNGGALIAWEIAYCRRVSWLQSRWFGIILFLVALSNLSIPILIRIVNDSDQHTTFLASLIIILYILFLPISYWYYRYQRRDLLALTLAISSLLIILTTWQARFLHETNLIYGVLPILITIETGFALKWLLEIAKEWRLKQANG
jgi:uncharacterized membrane protein